MMRTLFVIGAFTISLYVAVCALLFAFQRSLIYYPQPRTDTTSSSLLKIPVGRSTAFVSAKAASGAQAVLYFGGNAEDVSQDMTGLAEAFPNQAIYALHYPGYGESTGKPTQKAIFADALALFDFAHANHSNVVVIGRSLGSGVAVWTASKRPASGLVLITPFASMGDVAQSQYRFLPVRWLLLDGYDSSRYAPLVKAPTRIIVAEDDELIPRTSTERLRNSFGGMVSETVLPGVGHNTVQNAPNYWATISSIEQ